MFVLCLITFLCVLIQDRVIINRLDSVCHAILKGKWPSSSEQYDSPGVIAANSCLANSLAQHHQQRASFLSTSSSSVSVPGQSRVQPASHGLGFPLPPPLTRLPKVRIGQNKGLLYDSLILTVYVYCIFTVSCHGS